MRSIDSAFAACLAVTLVTTGCAADHWPPPISSEEREKLEELPKVSVCFESLIPVIDYTIHEGGKTYPGYIDRNDASHQIEVFRATGLFSRVTLGPAPDSDCDLRLILHEVPYDTDSLWMVIFALPSLCTFSVIPAAGWTDWESWISVADAPDEILRFECRGYQVVWFPFAGLIAALPGWKRVPLDDDAVYNEPRDCGESLALFLFENRARIWPSADLAP